MNFLAPLVKEMKVLWNGVFLKSGLSRLPFSFRAALVCISCDVPAARKLCGFKSHNSHRGFSKCFKFFLGNVGYSFDFSLEAHHSIFQWPELFPNFLLHLHLKTKLPQFLKSHLFLELFFSLIDPLIFYYRQVSVKHRIIHVHAQHTVDLYLRLMHHENIGNFHLTLLSFTPSLDHIQFKGNVTPCSC